MFSPCFPFVCWSSLILILLSRSSATATNRTIDDYYGDSVTGYPPVYSGSWNYGPTCSGCSAHPNATSTFNASWHDATSDPTVSSTNTITLAFNGTAIWVYGIMLNSMSPSIVTVTNVTFAMDGATSGTFVHTPDPEKETPDYNFTIYSKTGLQNGEHMLVMTMMQDSGPSVLMFDWAIYTHEDGLENIDIAMTTTTKATWSDWHHHDTESWSWDRGARTSSGVNKGAIAGSVAGGVVALALICGVFTYWCRRKKKHERSIGGQDLEANDVNVEPGIDKPVLDPTPVQSAAIIPSPGFPSADPGRISPVTEKTRLASPKGVYGGEVIDIRPHRMMEKQPSPAHGQLKEQVDDLKRQVANLRSALTTDASDVPQSPFVLMPPPGKRRRRREKARHEKLREQLEEIKGQRRGSERDTLGGDPPPAYDH